MDYYKKFIEEEYEWIYDFGSDSSSLLLKEFEGSITDEEFEENFELFKTRATELYVNDEYYIQQLHEQMDVCLRQTLDEYCEDKEKFINDNKVNDEMIIDELYKEAEHACDILKRFLKITNPIY